MQFNIKTNTRKVLADTLTPVSIYLKMRDMYPGAFLLESSDYHGNENSFSFVCLQPVASFIVDKGEAVSAFHNGQKQSTTIQSQSDFAKAFHEFMASFKTSKNEDNLPVNGLFGYSTYDAVQYFETIKLKAQPKAAYKIPDVCYQFFKYVIAINHFKNMMYIV